ncbi:Cupin domain protein [Paraliobacillus sp. PM-2]|uniref:cupin domain-containing protein n=1 Tax=Paraliobacillus sp. PM-2 TaxID=1462524 RepID=UPI00061C80E0|nr:cupin domain-containing protein [Paraliobacillus sp. PM-2]CQR47296.1 Cupin domain protein [Paraliobacillus sp. PM-2]
MYYNPFMYQTQWVPVMNPYVNYANSNQPYQQANPYTMQSMGKDYGGRPYVLNIDEATKRNKTFRSAIWTGTHLQVTLMCIGVGEDIGLETHPNTDQFLRIEEGQGLVLMGNGPNQLDFRRYVTDDDAIMVPAGAWHNLVNTGKTPLKLYSIYAPPEHPFGTIHQTKEIAMEAEKNH